MPHLSFDDPRLTRLRYLQEGVVSRRQLLELGATDADVARMVRRRQIRRLHAGVYVDHTGPLSRRQREWAAVLALWPAALTHASALQSVRTPTIQVAVGHHRQLLAPPGVALVRSGHLDDRVSWNASPPRVVPEHAVVDEMSARVGEDDVPGAFALLAQVLHQRETYPDRIAAALASRSRVRGRAVIGGLLDDHATGACSVLERGYLQRVERPHGLPTAMRQVVGSATGKRSVEDVRYEAFGVIVELDGRTHDAPAARDNDARRDLANLATGDAVTARVTYGLVYGDQCRTAAWIGRLLQKRGWRGALLACPSCRDARRVA